MNHEGTSRYTPEALRGRSYLELIKKETEGTRIWDYLRYDREGDLWINDVRVMDLVQYGTPLEIVDTRIIERRAKDWVALTQKVAREVGYHGGFKYFYAAKADFDAEFTSTAYRAGWNAETTSTQDLVDIEWLAEHGLFDKQKTEIYCNGFFLGQEYFGHDLPKKNIKSRGVVFDTGREVSHAGEMDYVSRIVHLHDQGYKITPIIYEMDELKSLMAKGRKFDIGVRLKFGKVDNDRDLARLPSRHGLTWEQMQEVVEYAVAEGQLRPTTFLAMVGAAENIPRETFDKSLLFAADKYFALRGKYDTFKYFDIGGGVVPLGEKYDHENFLRTLLFGLKEKAARAGLPEPTVVFEQGSPLAAEAAFDVMKIVHSVQTHIDKNGRPKEWAIADLSIIATMPDIWFIGKRFNIIAANNANAPAKKILLGDLTCDGGSVNPDEVLIPNTSRDNFLVVCSTGAYQNVLAGEGGVHHCGLYEPVKWKIVSRNGVTKAYMLNRQTPGRAREILGYTEQNLRRLR